MTDHYHYHYHRRSLLLLVFFPLFFLSVVSSAAHAAAPVVPGNSGMGRAGAGLQRLLLSALDADSQVGKAGWRMADLSVAPAPAATGAKLGQGALRFRGDAAEAGAKGDFTVSGPVPGNCRWVGMWVHLGPGANVGTVGFQFHDGEGESLTVSVPADWQGWKWVEADLSTPNLVQSYEQAGKNRKVDLPLQSVHAVWFARAPGASEIGVDALVAAAEPGAAPAPLPVRADLGGAAWAEPGTPLRAQLVVTNVAPTALPAKLEWTVQRDPALFSAAPPDPAHGSDHALGARSWTEAEGKKIESGSLTDGKDWTNASTDYKTGHFKEAFQFVDLGRERRITRLGYLAGDANWVWKVDVDASADGKTFTPVPFLQGVNLHQQWGNREMPLGATFAARHLRLRYHNDNKAVDVIRMPSALAVYDGTADEKWAMPAVGEVVARGTGSQEIPARSFDTVAITANKPLPTGAYLVAVRLRSGTGTQLLYRHLFVLPAPMKAVSAASRFGLNSAAVAHNPSHQRLGIGWVRFENMKWPMISPEPGVYKYDGTVAPWNVRHDEIVDGYRAQGIHFLPFLFLTPDYATSAPPGIDKNRWSSYPPKDNALMADFVFQTVARYGRAKHPAGALKTPDKKSGLNKVHVFEIWNEPNLTDPGWGPWVGTSPQYLEMFRAAAQAVKRADPKALVTNGGYAGIQIETVDELRAYRYADGKKPLDFVDVLNVHHYTGRVAPEIATVDTNVDRSGGSAEGKRTYEDDLRRLVAWRDKHKPGMPIWLTETGYDTGGPWGVSEQWQAARLPRVVMLALANGIDKAFVYRESGSTPSLHAASGLFRDDGTTKPSWFTYATLIRELDGVKPGRRLPHPDPNVRLYTWTRGKETILTAWTIDGAANLGLDLGRCIVTDAFGNRQQRNAAKNFRLSIFPVYLRSISNRAPLDALAAKGRRDEALRQQALARQAKLRAYLFDFGSKDNVGTIDIGTTRTFTPVLAADTFDATRGYGFAPGPAMKDESMHWISDPLDRDAARVGPGMQFRFRAAPGRYRLRLGVSPFTDGDTVTLRGASGGPRTARAAKDGPPVEFDVEVGNEPLSLELGGYALVRWLTLVERERTAGAR